MGFYLRQSVSVGPFRFGLSGSGVGVSVGVRGFRIGTGPRGNYVHLSAGGVHYRQSIPGVAAPRMLQPAVAGGTHAPLEEIESASAAAIVDSSSEELLNEIREKRRTSSLAPLALVASVVALLLEAAGGWPGWAIAMTMMAAAAAYAAAARRDRIAKSVVILYELEPAVEASFRRFVEWGEALAGSRAAWHIAASGDVYDRKYHAGASALVRRHPTRLRFEAPPFVTTNVPVLSIGAGRQTLYFLPDRLLVYDAAGVGAVTYATLRVSAARQRFIEEGSLPSDATVVGHTWRYVNRNGGPDRRFNNNPQIPICLYDELSLQTATGLNETVQVSRCGTGDGFVAAVRHLATVVR